MDIGARLGPRGWWPLPSLSGREGRDAGGYLKASSRPIGFRRGQEASSRRFEIAVGAVLAQNTAWRGASLAVSALAAGGLLSPKAIMAVDSAVLAGSLKSAGTYQRKAVYLKNLALAWNDIEMVASDPNGLEPGRKLLISLSGVGFETADCVLVYAYGHPLFIADAYARRILSRLGFVKPTDSYETVRFYVEERLPRDACFLAEGHALFVEFAKRFCRAKPLCEACPRCLDCVAALKLSADGKTQHYGCSPSDKT